MANSVTLGELKTRALDRADMSLGFIDDDRLRDWANAEASELYDLLLDAHEDWFRSLQTIALDGSESYDLPVDFYRALKVFAVSGTNNRIPLERFNLEKIDWESTAHITVPRYRILADKIYFTPTSSAGTGTIELWYAPQMLTLNADEDPISYAIPQLPIGWEDYIVVGMASRAMIKEESDATPLLAEKERMRVRLTTIAAERDQGRPNKVQDVRRYINRWW